MKVRATAYVSNPSVKVNVIPEHNGEGSVLFHSLLIRFLQTQDERSEGLERQRVRERS